MTKKSAQKSSASKSRSSQKLPGKKTLARTVASHESDPGHKFHAQGSQKDGRVSVAAGERLQRVRARAQAN